MTPETKRLILLALSNYRGDDHLRARAAFRGLSPEAMQQEHGQSGRTRQEILDSYQQHADAVDAAEREVERL